MTPGSSVPDWLQQALPAWFHDRPALTEGMWAITLALRNTSVAVFTSVYAAADTVGMGDTLPHLLDFTSRFHWLPIIVTVVIPAMRGKKAFEKAAAAAQLPASPEKD